MNSTDKEIDSNANKMEETVISQPLHFCKCDHIYEELEPIDLKILRKVNRVIIHKDQFGTEIILITNNDEVLGYGRNSGGRLGFGNNTVVKELTIIPELYGKQVKQIKLGADFSVALTETGEIYTSGLGSLGRTGTGDTDSYFKPTLIPIKNQTITTIYCCLNCTLVLTKTGHLYSFGCYGFDDEIYYLTPTQVAIPSDNEIISISCGADHLMALSNAGKVFSWGNNYYGQLGLTHNNHVDTPQVIALTENIQIKQIYCGYNHSLLLTSEGRLYSMGFNCSGQLGTGNKDNRNNSQLVLSEQKEICCFRDISMSIDVNNKLYVWGDIGDKLVLPELSGLSSFQKAIDKYSLNRSTVKPLLSVDLFKKKSMDTLIKTMAKAFNNSKNSDLKFKAKCRGSESEFKYIYGHKWFIEETSEYFQTMFANNWSESETNEVKVTGFSYEAFYQYIKSLYTDSIDSENIEDLLEILSITEQYMDCEKKDECVKQIKEFTDLENVCSVYSSAIKYRSDNLKAFAFKMMSKSIGKLIETTDYKNMEGIHAKDFFTEYHQMQRRLNVET